MQNDNEMIPTSLMISKGLWEKAKKLAIDEKTSLADIIRQGLELVLLKYKKKGGEN